MHSLKPFKEINWSVATASKQQQQQFTLISPLQASTLTHRHLGKVSTQPTQAHSYRVVLKSSEALGIYASIIQLIFSFISFIRYPTSSSGSAWRPLCFHWLIPRLSFSLLFIGSLASSISTFFLAFLRLFFSFVLTLHTTKWLNMREYIYIE